MLTCTHTECGHKWSQYLLPDVTHVAACPVCEEEAEEREADRLAEIYRGTCADNDAKEQFAEWYGR